MNSVMHNKRTMGREIGTAIAVLAIYLLTLLAPMHQARASQLVFEELGYSTAVSGWALCTAGDTKDDGRDVSVAKCPAAGIGKKELVLPSLDVLPAGFDVVALAPASVPVIPHFLPANTAPPSGPRAPPVSV